MLFSYNGAVFQIIQIHYDMQTVVASPITSKSNVTTYLPTQKTLL